MLTVSKSSHNYDVWSKNLPTEKIYMIMENYHNLLYFQNWAPFWNIIQLYLHYISETGPNFGNIIIKFVNF